MTEFKRGDKVKVKGWDRMATIRIASSRFGVGIYWCDSYGCKNYVYKGDLHAATKHGQHHCMDCVQPAE